MGSLRDLHKQEDFLGPGFEDDPALPLIQTVQKLFGLHLYQSKWNRESNTRFVSFRMGLSKELLMPEHDFETIKECRSCSSRDLVDILDLGIQPLANALVEDNYASVKKFPLTTAFCPACCLFQLKETVKKEILFDHYVWVTKTSKGAREYAETFANRVIQRAGLEAGDLVFEIASNDGTILKQFMARDIAVVGIEPAKNIAEMALKDGVRTDSSYWNVASAGRLIEQYGRPKVVIARNVMSHVSELHGVIEGIAKTLSNDGTGVIEFHSGKIIAEDLHYDSIYHEHLCFFTAHSLGGVLNKHGLYPYAVDKSPISGGSLVLYFSKEKHSLEPSYFDIVDEERKFGINERFVWEKFAKLAQVHRQKTLDLLNSLGDKVIVGFGSSARSSTFINFCGIGRNYLKAIIDNNPLKQGLMTPAGDVPIVSFDQGMALKPDVIFVLAWNFGQEIMDECSKRGFLGQYIMPFPKEPRLIKRK